MAKPRLCEILGVEVDERFMVEGLSSNGPYHINQSGNFVNESDCFGGTLALCRAIEHPEGIIHNTRWTEKDITDARAIKQLWPVANRVTREGIKIIVKFASVLLGKDDITLLDIWNETLFPTLKDGETIDIDEILEDEHEQTNTV